MDEFTFPPDCEWRTASEAIADAFIRRSLEIQRELLKLAERLDALEAGGLKFAGPFNSAMSYRKGTVVHWRGSAWVAVCNVEPGEIAPEKNSLNWSLFAARGRDASGTNR
jgi:hypothetical protein